MGPGRGNDGGEHDRQDDLRLAGDLIEHDDRGQRRVSRAGHYRSHSYKGIGIHRVLTDQTHIAQGHSKGGA